MIQFGPHHKLNIRQTYASWRLNGVSHLTCLVNMIFYLSVIALLPIENKYFAHVRRHFYYFYPQISANRPKFLDPIRVVVQTLFLLIFRNKISTHDLDALEKLKSIVLVKKIYHRIDKHLLAPLVRLTSKFTIGLNHQADNSESNSVSHKNKGYIKLLLIGSLFSAVIAVTQPFDVTYQFIFVGLMWVLAVLLKAVKNRVSTMLLIFISIIISTRYIYWRTTKTLLLTDWETASCAIILLCAELYAYVILVLSYFQVCWVLDRKPKPLPKDTATWPSVDIFIPSYNESLEVVKPCLLAALDLDWPKDKLKVHMLDDGTRKEFEEYCKAIGVNYIIRKEHNHAKAGNINHALTVTNGDIIAIFDCDHIPCRAFLQMTVGWMVFDKNIALVQTPHHFYSDDPFENNLDIKGHVPAENSLFHDFVQKGNDTWNATMFCGSCAIIRRKPLEEIGGIAVETVTEDAHTSLRLNRKGYSSAFLSMPLAAGLATESLADHINQRIRWARGMVQIFRIDNPIFGKGLTIPQRICFANAMIHFLHGLPRIIFLLAPLPYLFFGTYVIFASGLMILSYVLPHMVHSTLTNQRIQGNKRFYFWGVIYETILSWYITVPTLVALISPKHGKFNVTAKGASNEDTYFDWTVSKSYIFLIVLNFLGFIYGVYNIFFDPYAEVGVIIVNLLWVAYNLLILGAASAVALERRQVRASPRVECNMKARIEISKGVVIRAIVTDFSKEGLGVEIFPYELEGKRLSDLFYENQKLYIILTEDHVNYRFETKVRFASNRKLGLKLNLHTLQENIEYIRTTFASADRWSHSFEGLHPDGLMHGIHTLVKFGLEGYLKMLKSAPHVFKEFLWVMVRVMLLAFSLLPQPLDLSKDTPALKKQGVKS